MVVSGAYVAYYGWYELRIRTPGNEDDPVIDVALDIQRRFEALMPNTGNYGWYVVGALLLIGAAVIWARTASAAPDESGPQPPVTEPDVGAGGRSHGARV